MEWAESDVVPSPPLEVQISTDHRYYIRLILYFPDYVV